MICLALCMFLMAGCAGTNTGTGTSGDPLTEEDFAIYEEGKCIATVEEIMEANESGMRSFVYSWDGEELFRVGFWKPRGASGLIQRYVNWRRVIVG